MSFPQIQRHRWVDPRSPGAGTKTASFSLECSSAARVLLLVLSLALDRDGSLGTDTGGKVATIDAMVERGDWTPSIGYWADDVDPDGVAHPFFSTRHTEAGWVNVTTLPMILVTRLLVGGLGQQALLVVPILGAVLTCLAAGEFARFFGAPSWRPGFLAAASSSPVLVYGLDFWEHSIGLALMLWATVFFLKAGKRPHRSLHLRWRWSAGRSLELPQLCARKH